MNMRFSKKSTTYIAPDYQITDKDEIIKQAILYLQGNSLIDLWWFIRDDMKYKNAPDSFVRDVAHRMVGTGRFKFAYTNHQQDFLIVKASWHEAYPWLFAFSVALLSALISLLATRLTEKSNAQEQLLRESRQDSILNDLSSQIATHQAVLIDSVEIKRGKKDSVVSLTYPRIDSVNTKDSATQN